MKEFYLKYLYQPAIAITTVSMVYCVWRIAYSEIFIESVLWDNTLVREEPHFSWWVLLYILPVLLAFLPFYQYFNALKSEISKESVLGMPIFRFQNAALNRFHLPLSVLCLVLTPILVPYIVELEFPVTEGVYTHSDRLLIFAIGCILSVCIYGPYETLYFIRKVWGHYHPSKG